MWLTVENLALQEEIDSPVIEADNWQMEFNPMK